MTAASLPAVHPLKGLRAGQHELPLELLRTDGDTQMRAGALIEAHVAHLVEAYHGSIRACPPLIAYWDGESLWLADGFHRLEALRRRGETEAWVEVRRGTQLDAQVYACGANTRHGQPASWDDKRKAVRFLLQSPDYRNDRGELPSNRDIARAAGVSHTFVNKLRAELEAELEAAARGSASTPPPQPEVASSAEVTLRDPSSTSVELEQQAPAGGSTVVTDVAALLRVLHHHGTGHTVDALTRTEALALWSEAVGAPELASDDEGQRWGAAIAGLARAGLGVANWARVWRLHERRPPNRSERALAVSGRLRSLSDEEWAGLLALRGDTAPPAPAAELDLDDPAMQGHLASLEDPGTDFDTDDTSDELEDLEEDPDRSDTDLELGVEFVRLALEQLEAGAAGVPSSEETVCELALGLAEIDEVPDEVWQEVVLEGQRRGLWTCSGGMMRRRVERASLPAMPPEGLTPAPTPLPDDERAENDAYWTPDLHAGALTRWLAEHVKWPARGPYRILEPAAGGGAWLRACRDTWGGAELVAYDIDPDAPGLEQADYSYPVDYMQKSLNESMGGDIERYNLVVGNPPYAGNLVAWIARSRQMAPVVGYLLRGSFIDGVERWLKMKPAYVIVLSPRPKWEGPGARPSSDKSPSIFIVWVDGWEGPTQLHWLDVREGA